MAEASSIMGLVAAFIGVAIMLGVGTQILGNTSMDCSNLPGYNATLPSANETRYTGVSTAQSTGWAGACEDNNTSSQNAYALLIIILIVVAAVAILFVVRML